MDLHSGFRCFTMDVITSFCFARSVAALDSQLFQAPIIDAMEASLPAFIIFKNFPPLRIVVFSLPPWMSVRLSPEMAGLVQLQQILSEQVTDVIKRPESLEDAPHPIIYHELLKTPKGGGEVPPVGSLYEEGQALLFGGAETGGTVLMLGTFHLLEIPQALKRLKEELWGAWPDLDHPPRLDDLEKLPFLASIHSIDVTLADSDVMLRVPLSRNRSESLRGWQVHCCG